MLPINKEKFKKSQGQAIILTLLLMAIGLTVGASIITRTLREYREASYQSQYSQAETAAEAGLEEALSQETLLEQALQTTRQGYEGSVITFGQGTYKYNIEPYGYQQEGFMTAKTIEENEVVEIRVGDFDCSTGARIAIFSPYNGNITIFWNDAQRIETRIYKISESCEVILDRDIDGCGSGSWSIGDESFNCSQTVGIDGTAEILRIRPIGKGTKIGIVPDGLLPVAQSIRIISQGASGQASVQLEEEVSRPFLPSIFDYLLFSGTGIEK